MFWNIHEIITVNTRLRDALNKRQKAYAVVEQIGDVLMDSVPHFAPFVSYGAHQMYGKYEFEKEKSSNPAFAQFVEVSGLWISDHFVMFNRGMCVGYGTTARVAQIGIEWISNEADDPSRQVPSSPRSCLETHSGRSPGQGGIAEGHRDCA